MTPPSDKKIFLAVLEGGLSKSSKSGTQTLQKAFSTPEKSYRENLKKLAQSYEQFLKVS